MLHHYDKNSVSLTHSLTRNSNIDMGCLKWPRHNHWDDDNNNDKIAIIILSNIITIITTNNTNNNNSNNK